MASEREWAEAFLAQARADLAGAACITTEQPSVFAMLMQMAFEKLAKAALLRSGAVNLQTATTSHRAASLMVRTMRLERRRMSAMGGPLVWNDAFEIVEALERAHPSLAQVHGGPQLEYPWLTTAGAVAWPAQHLPVVWKLGDPKSAAAARVLRFAQQLDRSFDQVFP